MKFVQDTPQNKTFAYIVLWAAFIALITMLGMFGGCKSAEKKQATIFNKLEKVDRKAQKDSVTKHIPAKWSLLKFPVQLTGTKTVYLPSKKIITHDTVVSVEVKKDTVYLTKTVTKNIHTTETVEVEKMVADPRPQALCNAEIKRLQTEISNQQVLTQKAIDKAQIAKDKLNKRTGIMWWLIIAVVVLLLWTFRSMFGFIR